MGIGTVAALVISLSTAVKAINNSRKTREQLNKDSKKLQQEKDLRKELEELEELVRRKDEQS